MGTRFIALVLSFLMIIFVLGCGSSKSDNKPSAAPPTPPAPATQQQPAFMNVTVSQFIENYNKEIKQRHGDKFMLTTENPASASSAIYEIPEGKGSTLIINFNPTDKKVTTVTFTVQGEAGGKFDKKTVQAWTAAIINATSPGISYDDVVQTRGTILNGTPVTKNGIFYMAQNSEGNSPFFQVIARAK